MLKSTVFCSIAALLLLCGCSSTPPKPQAAAPTAPAVTNIAGDWLLTVQTPQGPVTADMKVVQSGKDISGEMKSQMGNVDYTGTIDGKAIAFKYNLDKFGAPAGTVFTYTGTVDGNTMKGDAVFAAFGSGEWSAKRK